MGNTDYFFDGLSVLTTKVQVERVLIREGRKSPEHECHVMGILELRHAINQALVIGRLMIQ
ncbi:MAG: hypothetical protein QM706_18255 [Nitrospira sp.]